MLNSIFEKKNTIYKLNESNVLPFEKEDLKIKSSQNITSTTINRVLNNLVENDLYNEQLTKNVKNSINVPGATVTGSREAVIESSDGQKFILTSNTEPHTIIGKRKVADIEHSISAVNDLSNLYVNFIINDGVNYIAGTLNGLYTSEDRQTGWRLINENDFFQKSFLGYNCRCILVNSLNTTEYLNKYSYFIGTNDGLFAFFMYKSDAYWFLLHPIRNINCLKLNKFDNLLYIATDSGLFWSDGLRYGVSNKTASTQINDIYILDDQNLANYNNEMLIGSSDGIKQSSNGYYLNSAQILHTFDNDIEYIGKLDTDNQNVYIKLKNSNTTYKFDVINYAPSAFNLPTSPNFTTTESSNYLFENSSLSVVISSNIKDNINVSSIISADIENDMIYYAISTDIDNSKLTFQTERLVTQIVPLKNDIPGEYNYLFNDNVTLSVYDTSRNDWITIDMTSLENLRLNYTFPITNVMTFDTIFDNNIILTVGKNLIMCKSYHLEKEFVYPLSSYSILKDNFFNKHVTKIYNIDTAESNIKDKNFLIGCADTISYIRDLRMCITYQNNNSNVISGRCNAITTTTTGAADGYKTKHIMSVNGYIYSTTDNINLKCELSSLPDNTIITYINAANSTSYNICTTDGLYITETTYDVDDELRKFTVSSVTEQTNDAIIPYISLHIQNYHASENNDFNTNLEHVKINEYMTILDKKAPAKLNSIPDTFTTNSTINTFNSIKEVKNDYVETIEFNDNNSFIKASINNWTCGVAKNATSIYSKDGYIDRFEIDDELIDLSKIPYIYKLWKSGMKEIVLYVPSTLTYYINNPKGFSNSIYNADSIERKNVTAGLNTTNIISEKATKLRVVLNNNHFGFTNISHIQINGNSLPLKIYKDNIYCQEGRENLFDTVIQPSIVESLPIITSQTINNVNKFINTENELVLNFLCYGTDSQSIKILGE